MNEKSIVERLREWASDCGYCAPAEFEAGLLREAADKIERQQAALERVARYGAGFSSEVARAALLPSANTLPDDWSCP